MFPLRFRMKGLLIILVAVSSVVAPPPQVMCTSSNPAELSGNVTLTCEFRANLEVVQITWQKKRGKDTQDMMTWSEKFGTHITDPFSKHITVLKATLAESSILITKLEKEDEACYNCFFHTHPRGRITGEVCLTDLKSVNKVLCNGQGNGLRIDLNPRDIQTRQSVQLFKKIFGATNFSTVKGQYLDPSINPTCEFWLDKERVQENKNHSQEDADLVSIHCSASGTKKFGIIWSNEGQPVRQEDKVNRAGNLITVTSTLDHTVSSLPADHRIICTIMLSVPPGADLEKTVKKSILGNGYKDDPYEYEAQQQRSKYGYVTITAAEGLFLVMLILLLFYLHKATTKTEARTPMKLEGLQAPTSSIKKSSINGWDPFKLSIESESGPAIPSSATNEGNSFQRWPEKFQGNCENFKEIKETHSQKENYNSNEYLCR